MENLKHMKKLNGTKVLDKVKKNIRIFFFNNNVLKFYGIDNQFVSKSIKMNF